MSAANPNILSHPLAKSEDSDLIASLHALATQKNRKLVKSTVYPAPADPSIEVRSWKMTEHRYYDVPSPFPTLARGIFSVEIPQEEKDGKQRDPKYRIVARGYDKFFNIGEVPWNTWESLEAHTVAPYILSLKSNGCIIFIGALTPSKLLITSKHAIGSVKDQNGNDQENQAEEDEGDGQEEGVVAPGTKSHADAGEAWVRKYLKTKGKTEADFAKVLWDNNWTAIAELCDDSFEEHVLPYPPHLTGLHLHGINSCTKVFSTLPQDAVDRFAEEWGFIRTLSTVCNSIEEVKEFTEKVGMDQVWEGQAVEGFVVRTHIGSPPPEAEDDKGGNAGMDRRGRHGKNPYSPGSTFFFKVKFDEPYMMYRDWREVTKALLSLRSKQPSAFSAASANSLHKNKMKRPETRVYVKWVIGEIKRDPGSFADFGKGRGIIATREKFFKWVEETEEGKAEMAKERGKRDVIEKVATSTNEQEQKFDKTIIVPIAIPGCGKTTLAVALAHIFGFGHTQSDDVLVKKAAPVFIKNVMDLLKKHDVVIADKNNHLRQHRSSLREAAAKLSPPKHVRLLALSYPVASLPHSTLIRICGDRVVERGDNHQTLRADKTGAKSHEQIVWGFIGSFEELSMDEVDDVIEVDLEWSMEEAVRYSVEQLSRILELPKPSNEKVKEGLSVALGYKPTTFKPDTEEKTKEAVEIKYFALMPEVDIGALLQKIFEEGVVKEQSSFFEQLAKGKRITKRSHVTLVHKNSFSTSDGENQGEEEYAKGLWDRSEALHTMSLPPTFEFKLTNVVWDDRVMTVVVEDLLVQPSSATSDKDQKGAEFLKELPDEVRARLHITVGTENDKIPPVEGKALMERWRKGEQGIYSLKLADGGVKVVGRVKGLQY
ncbi:hypothetical protein D9758_002719 [Tetrapyrgos nigripes]|uniref:RNA ligase (ATP) n=1 Tax=Tetrapyrgos nigripes TaxID=182062 RepID=A0A8H5LU36_9AGAR|nr:hypothetical protein D9758_002719 [Tetrapyrgos nigripes]